MQTYSGQSPWGNRTNLTAPTGGLEDPWRDIPGGNIFPYTIDKDGLRSRQKGQFYTQRPDTRVPYSRHGTSACSGKSEPRGSHRQHTTECNLMHVWSNKPLNPAIYFHKHPAF